MFEDPKWCQLLTWQGMMIDLAALAKRWCESRFCVPSPSSQPPGVSRGLIRLDAGNRFLQGESSECRIPLPASRRKNAELIPAFLQVVRLRGVTGEALRCPCCRGTQWWTGVQGEVCRLTALGSRTEGLCEGPGGTPTAGRSEAGGVRSREPRAGSNRVV